MSSSSVAAFRARVNASEERLCACVCEHVDVGPGRLYHLDHLARVYDVNVLRRPNLTLPTLDADLRTLWQIARAHSLSHLLIAGDDFVPSVPVADALKARGFYRDALVCMRHAGAVQPRAPNPKIEVHVTAPSPSVQRLYRRVYSEESWYTPDLANEVCEALFLRAASGVVRLYGAFCNGVLAGALGYAEAAEGLGTILAVATDPDMRNRGVASTLIDATLAAARANGATDSTYLITRVHDWPRKLYHRRGFEDAFVFESWGRSQAQ